MAATTIVSDPDTDNEAVPEDERFYFFFIASHQVMSKVSRRVKRKEITFGHVRRGLEGTIDAEFKFRVNSSHNLPWEVQWLQENRASLNVFCPEFGIKDTGSGTRSDPYQIHIAIKMGKNG